MAVIPLNVGVNRRKHHRRFAGRLVPDMTAMVGLGFLLVTFFIMAGEFMKSSVIQVTMPMRPTEMEEESTGIICRTGNVATLLLGKDHQVHYFLGLNSSDLRPDLHTTNLGPAGLRQVLLKLQRQSPETIVLIKPTADAKYKDMVDVLDEMNITNQRKYAMVDLYPEDTELLRLNTL